MEDEERRHSIQPGFRIGAFELSYRDMAVDASGSVMSRDQKAVLRESFGYCATCTGIPILLFDIRKSRLNPLWMSKKPRTMEGESLNGQCLRCKPEGTPGIPLPGAPSSTRSIYSGSSSFDTSDSSIGSSLGVPVRAAPSSISSICSRSSSFDRSSSAIGSSLRAPNRRPPLSRRSEHVVRPARAEHAISSISAHGRLLHQSTSTQNIGTESSTESNRLGDSPSQESNVEEAIRDLEPLVKDLLEAGADSSGILIEILVVSMNSFSSVECFQSFCLQSIWKSCKANTEACAASLMASNVHKNIMKAVKSFPSSKKVQEYGCKIVFAIAAHSSNRVALVRSGACSFLAEAMGNFMENVSLVRNVIGALRNLSLDTEAREKLNSIFAWKGTVKAMRHNFEDAAIQRDGCALLSNLVVDAENRMVLSVSDEVLGAVVHALETHPSNVSVITSACFALKNFTYEASNLRSMSTVHNIFTLLQIAREITGHEEIDLIVERLQMSRAEDDSLEEQAHESLMAMIELQSERPSEMIATVVNVLKAYSWSTKIADVCTQLLREHAAKYDIHKRNVLDAGTLEELKGLERAFGVKDTVRREAIRLIAYMEDTQNRH
jgi:hypothetical protein